jgi:hypothetical protein
MSFAQFLCDRGAILEFLDKTGVGKMAGGLGHDEYGADENEE